FERAETEPQRMRLTLREQALAVEGPKVLLDEAPHHVADVRQLAMATAAGEPIRIDEGHEREEVLVLTVVRGGRQEQQVSGAITQSLPELEALRLLELVPVPVRRHLVRLVDDHEIPLCELELGPQVVGPSELVDSGDEERLLEEGVPGSGSFDCSSGHQLEGQSELLPQLVLPLFD